jgi:hypothetical protein
MTSLLEEAIQKAIKLPDQEQDALASILLEQMESDRKWEESFARSTDVLEKMAEEALEEDRQGRTVDLDSLL